MRGLFVLLMTTYVFVVQAQNNDERLAAQYFSSKEFTKAADLYEDLSNKQPQNLYYYDNLLQCYIQLKSFKEAEKLLEKRQRKYPEEYTFFVDQAYIYKLQDLSSKQEKICSDLLKLKLNGVVQTEALANAFVKRKFYAEAIKVYEHARQQFKEDFLFANELSEVYFNLGQVDLATRELVMMAGNDPFLYEDIKDRLAVNYQTEAQYQVLSKVLLQLIQKAPDNYVYNDFLIWSFTQQKDWNGALIQAKAVDKRLKEEGRSVLVLAQIMLENEAYEYALKCYDYVLALGDNKRYFYQAQQGVLNCGLLQIKSENGASIERLKSIETAYLQFLNTNGRNWQTAQQMKDLAELYLYYMHNAKWSIQLMKEAIAIPGLSESTLANCKLVLADAYLVNGESWDADLLYKQVEKAFLNDALGQEAKYRYARLCYFRGEFEWSQSQLDVLKDATSQLISNNALKLWLLIQDNLTDDSTREALQRFAQADLYLFQNHYEKSLPLLDSISLMFPNHSLSDEILYSRALIAEQQSQFKQAEQLYQRLIQVYSNDILADNALMRLAKLYEFKLNDTANAKKIYELIVLNYSGSLYVAEARKRYRILRGDAIKEEEFH